MENLVYYYPIGHEAHFEPGHPERPERVEAIRHALDEVGWWSGYRQIPPLEVPKEVLNSVHTKMYLNNLEEMCAHGQHIDSDTYTTYASWNLALHSAGGAIAVASAVWKSEAQSGFALTRPPGHHATRDQGMGFCLLNNVALAAEYLIEKDGVNKVAIIDTDLHHGNGTQDIFWERGDVFYISTHQSPLYPGSGSLREIGEGLGEGKTANFPLPPGSGDQAFTEIMDKIILKLLDRHQPEMILISFGFDPHWKDPLGHLQLTALGYRNIIQSLKIWADDHCQGKMALFLEGGYDLEAGAACSQAVVSALLREEWQDPLGAFNHSEGYSWQQTLNGAMELWKIV